MLEQLLANIDAFVDTQLFVSLHVMAIVVHVILIGVAYLVFWERKISSYIQDRIGPNRVGFDFGLPALKFLSTKGLLKGCLGLGQPLADGIKFLLKEDYTPTRVDKGLFTLGPVIIIVPALIGFMIIPWGGLWEVPEVTLPVVGTIGGEVVHVTGAHVNVGIIYLLAVGSLGVYGVTLGGWASNSKYSFLGGLRATAQMISYEIPLGLSLLAVLLVVGSVMPEDIVGYQAAHGPMVLAQPLAAVLFFVAILAEANRAPFDNAEAEQELVGGYHTEYSSMRFALYFLAEYAHMVTGAAFFVLLFLGGYHLHLPGFGWTAPGFYESGFLGFAVAVGKFGVFAAKIFLVISLEMLIRWTLPRLRYDQVMMLGWQSLIPMSLAVVVMTSVAVHLGLTPEQRVRDGSLPAALSWAPLLGLNLLVLIAVYAGQGLLLRSTANRSIPMYGSRFNPVPGTEGGAAPTHPMALEDRPVQGTSGDPIGA